MISRSILVWLLLYVILLSAMSLGLYQARRSAIAQLGLKQATENWQEWRAAAGEQNRPSGPVQRRTPRSDAPPGLVLLRDHFVTSWLILVVLTSAVFFTLVFMIRGVISGPKFEPTLKECGPGRSGK